MVHGNGQLAAAINSSETLSAFTANYIPSGGTTGGDTVIGSVTSNCLPGNSYWYYGYPCYGESKTEKAYQVIRALMKAKIVKLNSLPEFFELMDELMKVL